MAGHLVRGSRGAENSKHVSPANEIHEAVRTGRPVRLHTHEGEVLVARVLGYDGLEVRYTVVRSSHPERYAICDSTGFSLRLDEIERAAVLSEEQAEHSGRRRP